MISSDIKLESNPYGIFVNLQEREKIDSNIVITVENWNILMIPEKYNYFISRDGSIKIESKCFLTCKNELEAQ